MSPDRETQTQKPSASADPASPNWVQVVQEQVASIRFGTVQITVHDGRVTQVERAEKLRFDRGGLPTGSRHE